MSNLIKRDETIVLISSVPLDTHPAAIYLASLQPGSRRSQKHALDVVARLLGANDCLTLNWGALRYQHTAAVRSAIIERYAPATANKILCALRKTIKNAWRLGQIPSEEYYRAVDIEGVSNITLPAGRELSAGEISALFQNCEDDPNSVIGARDSAMIAIAYGCGARRAEIMSISIVDYNPENNELIILHGKRNKPRIAHVVSGGDKLLRRWISIRGNEPGPLFCPVTKTGRIIIRSMTSQAFYVMLQRRAAKANINDFTPHDLRRSFVSNLLEAGADIATVAKMAGHSSIQTTVRYDRRPEETKRQAASLLHIPFRDKKKP